MELVTAWLEALRCQLAERSLPVTEVRVGVFYTAARLASGHVGVAFTPRDLHDTVCCPRSAAAAPAAGRLAGQEAWALARDALAPAPLRRAVGVAVLNALSALAMEEYGVPGGEVIPDLDALAAAGVQAGDRVALVGAFTPFIKALKGQVGALWVIDKHPEALKAEEQPLWRPPAQAPEVLAQADVALITGSALVEGGLEGLLDAARGARTVVLAGPTASPWPPPFFARGVHILGGLRVRDGERLLQLVSEGGSGYFFDEAAQKVCMVRQDKAAGLLQRVRR
ncbi:MAG: hypothetical protein KatS3mg131_3602 [Candidatus Tectimicrobiota bacterium]|nr:MAG: hypothetical protein KatS3mg131_3602 [Candidatus Tectomicrobia bacterium]